MDEEADEIIVPNMDKGEVARIIQLDCEERAALLFETYLRLTTVVYDAQSMVAILKKEDLDAST